MVCTRDETFELMILNKPFSQAWAKEKGKKSFNWHDKERKHDPYAVNEFGSSLETVFADTSRQTGMANINGPNYFD